MLSRRFTLQPVFTLIGHEVLEDIEQRRESCLVHVRWFTGNVGVLYFILHFSSPLFQLLKCLSCRLLIPAPRQSYFFKISVTRSHPSLPSLSSNRPRYGLLVTLIS